MFGVQHKGRKISMDLMLMLDLNETVDQLAMANRLHRHSHVLMREDGYIMGISLDFEVEGQRKKGRPKRTWKK